MFSVDMPIQNESFVDMSAVTAVRLGVVIRPYSKQSGRKQSEGSSDAQNMSGGAAEMH